MGIENGEGGTPQEEHKDSVDNEGVLSENTLRQLGKIADLLETQNVDASAIGEIKEVRVASWEVVTKDTVVDDAGNKVTTPHRHTLEGASLKFKPIKTNTAIDEQLFVSQAKPTIIKPGTPRPRRFQDRTALIVTDQQIGWRRLNEQLEPLHDTNATNIVHQIARDVQPDEIIVVGDNIDLPNMSRFGNDPGFVQTTQASLDTFHSELAQYRADVPDAEITVLEGNHEERWMKLIRNQAAELLGIRRANASRKLSVLGLEFLLRTDELEVNYLPGYPANVHWVNERLKVIHGNKTRSNGSTAAAYANSETTSTIFGHIHRNESHSRTVNERGGGRVISAHSFGTLSRIDGAVPSYHQGRTPEGEHLTNYENWQQGLGIVHYNPGDRPFHVVAIQIQTVDEYQTFFDGKIYTPKLPLSQRNKMGLHAV